MPGSVFVIAEAGVNHNGSVELGERLVDAAAEAGADAVKFQSFRAASLTRRSAPRAAYQVRNQPGELSQFEMLRRLELSDDAQRRLQARARARGIEFMSTPFDHESLRFLAAELGVARLKIGSGEITNGPLLLAAARTGLPIILSTGMSTIDEVATALDVVAFGCLHQGPPGSAAQFSGAHRATEGRDALRRRVSLLHCTSEYPSPVEDLNLRAMDTLRDAFGLPVGLSDHSAGIFAAVAAAARGASIIEKHFTLDRDLPGPDHRASLLPQELASMIAGIREAVASLGSADKGPTAAELDTRTVARRSLVAARPVRRGEAFADADLAAKRPAGGVSPMQHWDWVGRPAPRDFDEDDPL